MKILIPPSEGKARVKATNTIFSDTNFKFKNNVNQVVRLLELIEDEDLPTPEFYEFKDERIWWTEKRNGKK